MKEKNNIRHIRFIAKLFTCILGMVFVSFFFFGITHTRGVSLDYNIPIAKSILSGQFIFLHAKNPFMYFPGSSHVIMAVFLFLQLPINLFGLVSWIALFFACKKLGTTFGLQIYMAVIFAASICTTVSVIRTIGDQSIDKWLCTWFVFSLILLEKPVKNLRHSLLLGFCLGMLIGTKYSGPLFVIPLIIVYWKTLLHLFTPLRFLFAFIIFSLTGLFWYIRNFFLTGTPYFPANLPFLKGYPHFTQQDWMLWKIFAYYPSGILPLLNAFVSEYMIWSFSGLVVILFLLYSVWKRKLVDKRLIRLSILGVSLGIVSLLLPITPAYKIALFHIVSDMRYIYILMVVLILITYLIAQKMQRTVLIGTIAVLNALPLFSFLPYQPKVYLLFLFFVLLFSAKREGFDQKIYSHMEKRR